MGFNVQTERLSTTDVSPKRVSVSEPDQADQRDDTSLKRCHRTRSASSVPSGVYFRFDGVIACMNAESPDGFTRNIPRSSMRNR